MMHFCGVNRIKTYCGHQYAFILSHNAILHTFSFACLTWPVLQARYYRLGTVGSELEGHRFQLPKADASVWFSL